MPAKRRGRGEGNLEQLPSGSWRAVVSLGVDPVSRKRVRMSRTFETKREAMAWRADRQRESDAGQLTAAVTTVGEWLTTWLGSRKATVAANTYRTESDTAERRLRPTLGPVRFRDLTPVVIERWLTQQSEAGVSPNERRKAAVLLRKVLYAAVAKRVIASSPMRGVTIPRSQLQESGALDRAQLGQLLDAAQRMGVGPLFRLWADTGLRPGEILALTREDLDLASATIRVRGAVCMTSGQIKEPKTRRSRRTLALATSTVAALAGDLDQVRPPSHLTDPLFPTSTGRHWWQRNFLRDVFAPVVRAADLSVPCTPYTLRHTCATLLLQAGVSLRVVSERLGHEDVVTTLRSYAHVLPGMQEAAARVMESILNPAGPQVPPATHTGEVGNCTKDASTGETSA
jgi:integrase